MTHELDKAISALHHLSPNMPREDWARVCAAVRAAGIEFDTFDQWSRGGDTYDASACRSTWNSLPPKEGGIGVATLYGMAKRDGWNAPKAPRTGAATQKRTPPPPPAPAPTEAPKPPNPVYDLLNIWERAAPATAQHPYCIAKGVTDGPALEGLRVLPDNDPLRLKGHSMAGALLVPVCLPDGALLTVQCVAQVGTKPDGSPQFEKPNLRGYHFKTDTGAQGFHVIGQIQAGQPVHIVEGIGAAWAIYQATGTAAVVTFGVGRTTAVTKAVIEHHPQAWPVLVPDVGQEAQAQKTAKELGCAVVPLPGDWEDNTDAWDYLQAHGPQALADLLATATQPTKPPPAPTDTKASTSQIPAENERPAYVVFEDWHSEDGQKFRPGVWLFAMKSVGKGDSATLVPTQQWICSPMHVEAITSDAHDGSYGQMLRIKNRRGNWVEWAMPMRMLAGDGIELRSILLDMGADLSPNARQALAMYLQSQHPNKHLQCVAQTGWVDAKCKAFVLPDAVIGPQAADVVYQSEDRASGEYGTAGTLQGWQAGIAAMAVGNPMLALGLCAAFAGPVLAKVHAENGGPHFIGGSSTGKTSILQAACSVWGGKGYKRSWRATSNGLEAAAAMFNDCLLALDEISECDPKDVGEVVYMLGNGQGKQRATRHGGGRQLTRWRCAVISNGEYSIGTSMAEGGYRIKAGQQVRLFDVPCAPRAFGAWDTLHHHPSARALSDALKTEAATHYGHAGRAFLERLATEDSDLGELLAAIRARPEFSTDGEGQEQRVAGRFAVLAMAGELATDYGITGWPAGEAICAAAVGFQAWRSLRTDKTGANAEQGQIVQAVTDFIDKHGDSRFSDADATEDARAPLIRDRAGYWRKTDQGRVYLFIGAGMREALKGFDFGRALAYLEAAGLIGPAGQGGKRQRQRKIAGRNLKFYEVYPDGAEATE
ncbi:DUF927 domain-containing protein [Giesbergeria anulus]|uniref:Putative DNA primase/helicase n=1 Tax=Giesbergeria anulus TaxID=180197 RepID=A0A1H9F4W0_9BURK|nr:DUF927 domain-containing protein [Giesbergeria anulus]SEQ32473.1 putative DNA primase/helicase [Giesbergeria anulus]